MMVKLLQDRLRGLQLRLMTQAEDPEKYYIEVIMQEKIRLYLEYVSKHSFLYDIALIFKTFWVIVKER